MKIFKIILFLIITTAIYGQSPYQLKKLKKEVSTENVSAFNPWIFGAKLTFAVRDLDEGLKDNFVFSGEAVTFLIEEDKYALPVFGSIALGSDDIFAPGSGFNAGLYPYYIVNESEKFDVVAHGITSYKIIPGDTTSFDQFKAGVGLELIYYIDSDKLPITFSVTPTFLWNDGVANTGMLEVNAVLPVSAKVGLLAEYQRPFKGIFDPIFRLGIITIN